MSRFPSSKDVIRAEEVIRADERARIVTWLRKKFAMGWAESIEEGEYVESNEGHEPSKKPKDSVRKK